ncbi:hypothetical protein [Streptomyces sp. NPDC012746]|uniref:hypothetical protein n=1 Tax=Streptomyces sp. NPDC012746 TaxID=3364845 RepID=UPI00367D5E9D
MGDNMSAQDRHHALMVRHAMERTVAELAPIHDLVPAAMAQGRRRKARTRLAVGAAVTCVAGAAVFASAMLPTGGGATTVRPAATTTPAPQESPAPEPYRTPVHVEPTREGEDESAALPAAERERREEFQQRAAVLLDELLPDAVGLIRPVDLNVRQFQGHAEGGTVFPVTFSVRPSAGGSGSGPRTCPADPRALKGGTCQEATLPGGIKAISYRTVTDSPQTTATSVSFTFGKSDVSFVVNPSQTASVSASASAPVDSGQLLAAAADPRFLDLVRYADENPMQKRQLTVNGG